MNETDERPKTCGFLMSAGGDRCGRTFGHSGSCESVKTCPTCVPPKVFKSPLAYDDHIREKHVWSDSQATVPAAESVAKLVAAGVTPTLAEEDKVIGEALDADLIKLNQPIIEVGGELRPSMYAFESPPAALYRCVPCDLPFDRPQSLGAHNRHHHPKAGKASPPKATPKFTCSECETPFWTKDALKEHIASTHPIEFRKTSEPVGAKIEQPEPEMTPDMISRLADIAIEAARPFEVRYEEKAAVVLAEPSEAPAPVLTDDLFKKLERLLDDASQVMMETRIGIQRNWAEYEPLALRYVTILMDALEQDKWTSMMRSEIMNRIEKRLYFSE